MDVFTACLRRQVPIHVADSINIASSRQCKGCRQLSKVNGTAVIVKIKLTTQHIFSEQLQINLNKSVKSTRADPLTVRDILMRLLIMRHAIAGHAVNTSL